MNKSEQIKEKYYELLYAVEEKFPNETRHETALRFIKNKTLYGKETNAQH